jgi:predicted DCC family thiol-disulfide oxidoreductase YuxK
VKVWTKGRIAVEPWQAIPDVMAAQGLTAEDGLTQAWFVHEDGRLTGGAAAVNDALRYVWWARPFTFLYHLPGLKQLEDWLYVWVANNRYRLPGSTNQCTD